MDTGTFRALGQLYPPANTLSNIYVAPTNIHTLVSTIVVCNLSAVADTFRIALAVQGAPAANFQYIYYDVPIIGNDTFVATIALPLQAGDVLRVRSHNGTCSFNAFGEETAG